MASVSCIYGIGSPETYADMAIKLTVGERRVQDKFIRLLTDIQYKRNDVDFARGTFRVRGDVVDIFPAGQDTAVRVEFFGDEIERLTKIDPLTGEILTGQTTRQFSCPATIRRHVSELKKRLSELRTSLING